MTVALIALWAEMVAAQGFAGATAAVTGNGQLAVNFVLEGLRPGEAVTVQARVADARGLYICQKVTDGIAEIAGRREEVAPLLGGSTQLLANSTGGAAGSITLSPPRPTLRCDNGQALVLTAVSYGTVDLRTTGGLTAAATGSTLGVLIQITDPVLPSGGS